jgi:pSer/pThr/pTyr-binding forkhead associated (FHA) protein
MDLGVLTLLKLVLLALLYLFLLRVVRVIVADLYGPSRRKAAPVRRPVATAEPPRRNRRQPRELVVHPPEGRPRVVALDGSEITLGRSDVAAVVVDDHYVSDEHAQVLPGDEGWQVRDLGSTNGTFLNGAKVTQPTPLAAGDHLRIGKTRIEVRR